MTDTMHHPRNAQVLPERMMAYRRVGWTFIRYVGEYDQIRALMRWEGDGEPVIPARAIDEAGQ